MASDVEKWIEKDGEIFLKNLGIKKGQIILDFGCRVGHYTIPAAKVVGKKGIVYAIDKYQEHLDKLMKTAESEELKNIIPIKTSGELKISVNDASIDMVMLYDVLHFMDTVERKKLYNEIHRILKIGGLLTVYPKHYKFDEPLYELVDIKLENIIREVENANFYLERKIFRKLIHDDNYSKGYVINFRKRL